MISLLKDCTVSVLHRGDTGLAAADTTGTAVLDMAGYESAFLMTSLVESSGAGSTTKPYLQVRHADASTGPFTSLGAQARATITGDSTDDEGKALIVELYRPTKRYLATTVTKPGAHTSVMGPVFGVAYRPSLAPVTQSTGHVSEATRAVSPTT